MQTRQPTIADAINWDHALEFSYTAHHNEKLDYLCLFRSTGLTLKAYFFDEGSPAFSDVVVPHTHRYDFDTKVIAGDLYETRFSRGWDEQIESKAYYRWHYSPVVEGGGFFLLPGQAHTGPEREWLTPRSTRYSAGESYRNRAHIDIHTLTAVRPGTILLLTQYADQINWPDGATLAWTRSKTKPPSTDGLYEKMTRAQVKARVEQLQAALEKL